MEQADAGNGNLDEALKWWMLCRMLCWYRLCCGTCRNTVVMLAEIIDSPFNMHRRQRSKSCLWNQMRHAAAVFGMEGGDGLEMSGLMWSLSNTSKSRRCSTFLQEIMSHIWVHFPLRLHMFFLHLGARNAWNQNISTPPKKTHNLNFNSSPIKGNKK